VPDLIYGSASYDRETGNLPPLTLINMFVEKAATSENGACLQSRPGLIQIASNGAGPVRAIYSNRGTLNGDDFSVIGSTTSPTLYRGTTLIGTLTGVGTGPVSIAGSNSEMLIAAGGDLWRYNGTALNKVTFPDSAHVRAVCFIGSLFVAVRGTESSGAADLYPGRFYFSAVLDGNTWDALNYATAEREPDGLLDVNALNDKILLYGQSTIEVWSDTGAADLPFTRNEGMGSQSKGILLTGCQCEADNTKFHIGSDGVVYRFGEEFDRISDHWLEEKIIASTNASLFTFRWQGHEFVCVRLDSQTFAYDCATQAWSEFQTNGGQFIGQCAAMKGTTIYLGHQSTGQILGLSGWDDLGVALTREFTAAVQMDAPGSIDNLWLWVNTGQSTIFTGQGSDPKIEQQSSRDAGNTWTDFNDASLGNASIGGTGQYRVIPEWRRLGQYDAPGAMFRFRVTDPVPLRISAVKYNSPLGGRSRG
jgi:hypothetical protein